MTTPAAVAGRGRSDVKAYHIEARAEGWAWVLAELRRVRDEARAEAERLLGPDRGE